MKTQIGKYKGVKAITREEAFTMAKEIFNHPAWQEMVRRWHKRIRENWHPWIEAARKWMYTGWQMGGYVPHFRAVNFIAADLPDAVYSFVYWVYDGEYCPNPEQVEVVYVEENNGKAS